MKITKFEIVDFGRFTGNRIIEDIDSEIVLLYGKNEAGKTTIFNLIKSMMYGFFPAQAQQHPYSSWENDRIEFTAYLKTDSCDKAIVYRKLLSRPQGKYMVGEDYIDIKNGPLPINKHISQDIYNKIYSLRVEDLMEIQGKAWEEIEEKLLAGYGSSMIRSTRDVLRDLRLEYEKIWRESGRGKYLIKDIEISIKNLKKLKKEALIREEEIRGADNRIDDINMELKELKERKILIRTLLSKAKELGPIKQKLEQLETLNKRMVNEEIALSLPQDIRERQRKGIDDLEAVRDRITKTNQLLDKKISDRYIMGQRDKLMLESRTDINSFAKKFPRIEAIRENIKKSRYSTIKLQDRIVHEADNFLAEKWNDGIRSRFEELNKSELKILVAKYRNTIGELHGSRLKRDAAVVPALSLNPSRLYILSLVFALICAGVGFTVDISLLKIVGLGGAIYGVTGMFSYISMKRSIERNSEKNGLSELEHRVRELERQLEIDKRNLMNYLVGIPISNLMIDNIDDMFVVGLFKIKDMVYELGELEGELYTYEEEYEKERIELDRFLSQFPFESFIDDDEKIFILRDSLGELEKKIILDENNGKEIGKLEEEINSLVELERQIEGIVQDYKGRLSEVYDGDMEDALNVVEHNYSLKTRIDTLMDELNEGQNIDVLIKEIKGYEEENGWIFVDHEVLRAEDELDEINDRIEDLAGERAKLEERMNKLSQDVSLDEIESRLDILGDDLERAARRRDKLVLLSEIIRFADQKFKEENQPDVLKKAGKYFNIITNGKYTDIFIDDDDEVNSIMVKESGESIPKRVTNTFSKGTLNQLYLALRLSLIDHLDRDKEALPICFDELLINWDEERLESSLRLLREISQRRQIFIFTCHDWMAERVEQVFDTKRITL